jgi:hypothetical protein
MVEASVGTRTECLPAAVAELGARVVRAVAATKHLSLPVRSDQQLAKIRNREGTKPEASRVRRGGE